MFLISNYPCFQPLIATSSDNPGPNTSLQRPNILHRNRLGQKLIDQLLLFDKLFAEFELWWVLKSTTDPPLTEFRLQQMLILGLSNTFSFNFHIGYSGILPITDWVGCFPEIRSSLMHAYCLIRKLVGLVCCQCSGTFVSVNLFMRRNEARGQYRPEENPFANKWSMGSRVAQHWARYRG